MAKTRNKPRIFLDSDVVFAGAASPSEHGASHVILRMGEITLIECVVSEQVVTEVERNLTAKLSGKLPEFRLLVDRSLQIVSDPLPGELALFSGQADPKDLPVLVAALKEGCSHLLTFNLRHYAPDPKRMTVQRPGDFLSTVRSLLADMEVIIRGASGNSGSES
jgi:predicted nucleic acid-binding protein